MAEEHQQPVLSNENQERQEEGADNPGLDMAESKILNPVQKKTHLSSSIEEEERGGKDKTKSKSTMPIGCRLYKSWEKDHANKLILEEERRQEEKWHEEHDGPKPQPQLLRYDEIVKTGRRNLPRSLLPPEEFSDKVARQVVKQQAMLAYFKTHHHHPEGDKTVSSFVDQQQRASQAVPAPLQRDRPATSMSSGSTLFPESHANMATSDNQHRQNQHEDSVENEGMFPPLHRMNSTLMKSFRRMESLSRPKIGNCEQSAIFYGKNGQAYRASDKILSEKSHPDGEEKPSHQKKNEDDDHKNDERDHSSGVESVMNDPNEGTRGGNDNGDPGRAHSTSLTKNWYSQGPPPRTASTPAPKPQTLSDARQQVRELIHHQCREEEKGKNVENMSSNPLLRGSTPSQKQGRPVWYAGSILKRNPSPLGQRPRTEQANDRPDDDSKKKKEEDRKRKDQQPSFTTKFLSTEAANPSSSLACALEILEHEDPVEELQAAAANQKETTVSTSYFSSLGKKNKSLKQDEELLASPELNPDVGGEKDFSLLSLSRTEFRTFAFALLCRKSLGCRTLNFSGANIPKHCEDSLLMAVKENPSPILEIILTSSNLDGTPIAHKIHAVCEENKKKLLEKRKIVEDRVKRKRALSSQEIVLLGSRTMTKEHRDQHDQMVQQEHRDWRKLTTSQYYDCIRAKKYQEQRVHEEAAKRIRGELAPLEKEDREEISDEQFNQRIWEIMYTHQYLPKRQIIIHEFDVHIKMQWIQFWANFSATQKLMSQHHQIRKIGLATLHKDQVEGRGNVVKCFVTEREALHQKFISEMKEILRQQYDAKVRQEKEANMQRMKSLEEAKLAEKQKERAKHESTVRESIMHRQAGHIEKEVEKKYAQMEELQTTVFSIIQKLEKIHEKVAMKYRRVNDCHRMYQNALNEQPRVRMQVPNVIAPTTVFRGDERPVPLEPQANFEVKMDVLWPIRLGVLRKEITKMLPQALHAKTEAWIQASTLLTEVESFYEKLLTLTSASSSESSSQSLNKSSGGRRKKNNAVTASTMIWPKELKEYLTTPDEFEDVKGNLEMQIPEIQKKKEVILSGQILIRFARPADHAHLGALRYRGLWKAEPASSIMPPVDAMTPRSLLQTREKSIRGSSPPLSGGSISSPATKSIGDKESPQQEYSPDADHTATVIPQDVVSDSDKSTDGHGGAKPTFVSVAPDNDNESKKLTGEQKDSSQLIVYIPSGATSFSIQNQLRYICFQNSEEDVNKDPKTVLTQGVIVPFDVTVELNMVKWKKYVSSTKARSLPRAAKTVHDMTMNLFVAPSLVVTNCEPFKAEHDARSGLVRVLESPITVHEPPKVIRKGFHLSFVDLVGEEKLDGSSSKLLSSGNISTSFDGSVSSATTAEAMESSPLFQQNTKASSSTAARKLLAATLSSFRSATFVIDFNICAPDEDCFVLDFENDHDDELKSQGESSSSSCSSSSKPQKSNNDGVEKKKSSTVTTENNNDNDNTQIEIDSVEPPSPIAYAVESGQILKNGEIPLASISREKNQLVIRIKDSPDVTATDAQQILRAISYQNQNVVDPTPGVRVIHVRGSNAYGLHLDVLAKVEVVVADTPTEWVVPIDAQIYRGKLSPELHYVLLKALHHQQNKKDNKMKEEGEGRKEEFDEGKVESIAPLVDYYKINGNVESAEHNKNEERKENSSNAGILNNKNTKMNKNLSHINKSFIRNLLRPNILHFCANVELIDDDTTFFAGGYFTIKITSAMSKTDEEKEFVGMMFDVPLHERTTVGLSMMLQNEAHDLLEKEKKEKDANENKENAEEEKEFTSLNETCRPAIEEVEEVEKGGQENLAKKERNPPPSASDNEDTTMKKNNPLETNASSKKRERKNFNEWVLFHDGHVIADVLYDNPKQVPRIYGDDEEDDVTTTLVKEGSSQTEKDVQNSNAENDEAKQTTKQSKQVDAKASSTHILTHSIRIDFTEAGNATIEAVQDILKFLGMTCASPVVHKERELDVELQLLVGSTVGQFDVLGNPIPPDTNNEPLKDQVKVVMLPCALGNHQRSSDSFLLPRQCYIENSGPHFLFESLDIPEDVSFCGDVKEEIDQATKNTSSIAPSLHKNSFKGGAYISVQMKDGFEAGDVLYLADSFTKQDVLHLEKVKPEGGEVKENPMAEKSASASLVHPSSGPHHHPSPVMKKRISEEGRKVLQKNIQVLASEEEIREHHKTCHQQKKKQKKVHDNDDNEEEGGKEKKTDNVLSSPPIHGEEEQQHHTNGEEKEEGRKSSTEETPPTKVKDEPPDTIAKVKEGWQEDADITTTQNDQGGEGTATAENIPSEEKTREDEEAKQEQEGEKEILVQEEEEEKRSPDATPKTKEEKQETEETKEDSTTATPKKEPVEEKPAIKKEAETESHQYLIRLEPAVDLSNFLLQWSFYDEHSVLLEKFVHENTKVMEAALSKELRNTNFTLLPKFPTASSSSSRQGEKGGSKKTGTRSTRETEVTFGDESPSSKQKRKVSIEEPAAVATTSSPKTPQEEVDIWSDEMDNESFRMRNQSIFFLPKNLSFSQLKSPTRKNGGEGGFDDRQPDSPMSPEPSSPKTKRPRRKSMATVTAPAEKSHAFFGDDIDDTPSGGGSERNKRAKRAKRISLHRGDRFLQLANKAMRGIVDERASRLANVGLDASFLSERVMSYIITAINVCPCQQQDPPTERNEDCDNCFHEPPQDDNTIFVFPPTSGNTTTSSSASPTSQRRGTQVGLSPHGRRSSDGSAPAFLSALETEIGCVFLHPQGKLSVVFHPELVVTRRLIHSILSHVCYSSANRNPLILHKAIEVGLASPDIGYSASCAFLDVDRVDDPMEISLGVDHFYWRVGASGKPTIQKPNWNFKGKGKGVKKPPAPSGSVTPAGGVTPRKGGRSNSIVAGGGSTQSPSSNLDTRLSCLRLFPKESTKLFDPDTEHWDGGIVRVIQRAFGSCIGDHLRLLSVEEQKLVHLLLHLPTSREVFVTVEEIPSFSSKSESLDSTQQECCFARGKEASGHRPLVCSTYALHFVDDAGVVVLSDVATVTSYPYIPLPSSEGMDRNMSFSDNAIRPITPQSRRGTMMSGTGHLPPKHHEKDQQHKGPSSSPQVASSPSLTQESSSITEEATLQIIDPLEAAERTVDQYCCLQIQFHAAPSVDMRYVTLNLLHSVVTAIVFDSTYVSYEETFKKQFALTISDIDNPSHPGKATLQCTFLPPFIKPDGSNLLGGCDPLSLTTVKSSLSVLSGVPSPPVHHNNAVSPSRLPTPPLSSLSGGGQVSTDVTSAQFKAVPILSPSAQIINPNIANTLWYSLRTALDGKRDALIPSALLTGLTAVPNGIYHELTNFILESNSSPGKPGEATKSTLSSTSTSGENKFQNGSIEVIAYSGWNAKDCLFLKTHDTGFVATSDGMMIEKKELVCRYSTSSTYIRFDFSKDCKGATTRRLTKLLQLIEFYVDVKDAKEKDTLPVGPRVVCFVINEGLKDSFGREEHFTLPVVVQITESQNA